MSVFFQGVLRDGYVRAALTHRGQYLQVHLNKINMSLTNIHSRLTPAKRRWRWWSASWPGPGTGRGTWAGRSWRGRARSPGSLTNTKLKVWTSGEQSGYSYVRPVPAGDDGRSGLEEGGASPGVYSGDLCALFLLSTQSVYWQIMQEILSHVSKGGERVLETVSKGSSQAGVNILYFCGSKWRCFD